MFSPRHHASTPPRLHASTVVVTHSQKEHSRRPMRRKGSFPRFSEAGVIPRSQSPPCRSSSSGAPWVGLGGRRKGHATC